MPSEPWRPRATIQSSTRDRRPRAAFLFGEPPMRERFSSRHQAVGGEGGLVDSLLFTTNLPSRPVPAARAQLASARPLCVNSYPTRETRDGAFRQAGRPVGSPHRTGRRQLPGMGARRGRGPCRRADPGRAVARPMVTRTRQPAGARRSRLLVGLRSRRGGELGIPLLDQRPRRPRVQARSACPRARVRGLSRLQWCRAGAGLLPLA